MVGVIQAGGRSSRMGEDKAWLTVEGRPMIEHALSAAQSACEKLAIVINAANPRAAEYRQMAARWDAVLLFDGHDHRGPLGGIHTALAAFPNRQILILPCDMAFVTAVFLKRLQDIHEREANDLTVPVDGEGRVQMLVGIYAPACLGPITQMLDEDQLKVGKLCARVRARRVLFDEYAGLPDAARLLVNVNTPEEYRAALARTPLPARCD
jgi:molybdopterin-guanine dinucleotide biosynthesis protein A